MTKISFTKDEKKEIISSLRVITKDLRELWKLSQTEEIEITLPYEVQSYRDCYYLRMDDKRIEITDIIHDDRYLLEKVNSFGQSILTTDIRLAFEICKSYEKIRREVESEIKKGLEIKKYGLEELNRVKRRYIQESEVEVTLPKTMNQQELVLTSEDGRNVGILDFGNSIVKIVTDGEIKVVNHHESKVKIKGRY